MHTLRFSPACLSNLLHWQCHPNARRRDHCTFWIKPVRGGTCYTYTARTAPAPHLI